MTVARSQPKPKVVVKYRPYPVYPFPGLRGFWRRFSIRRIVERNAYMRGTGRGFNIWTALFVGMFLLRFARRARGPQLVARDVLKPGEGLVIRTITPPAGGRRKALRVPS